MRVAVATDWFPPRRGGIEAQLLHLVQGLSTAGHDVEVITSTPHATNGAGFRLRRLDVARIPGADVAISPVLFSRLRGELARGYDVVHAHVSVISPVGYAAVMVARSLGLPVVVTFHSVLQAKRVLLALANAIFEVSGGPIVWSAVSELVSRQASSALRGAPVRVLPNGVHLDFWRSVRVRGGTGHGDALTFVSTMRMHRKKRPRHLLRAYASGAAFASVPSRLVFIGEGPELPALRQEAARLGLVEGRARVEFRGWTDSGALRSAYADADAFAQASRAESFGIAALEARAAGLPVIAMRAAGSAEFLEDGRDALLCDDDEDLADAFRRFIEDRALRSRLAGHCGDLGRYDWSAVLALHELAYRDAMTRAPGVTAVGS